VRVWVNKNWWKWKAEKPEFMDEAFISRIPKEWLPEEGRSEVDAAKKNMRRRSSFKAIVPVIYNVYTCEPFTTPKYLTCTHGGRARYGNPKKHELSRQKLSLLLYSTCT